VFRTRYPWWTSVGPAETVALTGQYFVAESSIARRIAASSTPGPSMSWTSSTCVSTCGYSSRCRASTRISYRLTTWRFFAAIAITSIAEHAARLTTSVSTGLSSPRWTSSP
jgi:hypothetical protein